MNGRINNLFEELCELEPEFREQGQECMSILNTILESRPDTKFDEEFAKKLRVQILGAASRARDSQTVFGDIINHFKAMTTLYKFAAPVAVVVIIAAGAFYYTNQGAGLYFAGTSITNIGSNSAFGSLLTQGADGAATQDASQELTGEETVSRAIAPMGLGGGGGGGAESMMYPGPQNYRYTYAGDEFSLTDSQVSVLRRISGDQAAAAVSQRITSLNFGLFDVGSFGSVRAENVSFGEDREFGYIVTINFRDGSVSINENWQYWQHPGSECRDQACFDRYRLKESDMPSDERIIQVADAFLREYGIATDTFASPIVDKQWRMAYDEGQTSELYVPDAVQVRYPLMVNGETVYEQGGDPAGLVISVNIRFERVSSMWGLASQMYESSSYRAVTDSNRIVDIAEAGGLYGYLLPSRDALEIKLGTPERILMRQYNYQDGISQELLVPALSFPVISAPEEVSYWQKRSIIIPLAEELLVRDGGPIIYYEGRGGDTPLPEPAEGSEGVEEPAILPESEQAGE